jgi:hypothetical protein
MDYDASKVSLTSLDLKFALLEYANILQGRRQFSRSSHPVFDRSHRGSMGRVCICCPRWRSLRDGCVCRNLHDPHDVSIYPKLTSPFGDSWYV